MSEPHDLLVRAQALHAELVAALRANRRTEHQLAGLLRQMSEERLHQALGYASINDYARMDLDLEPRRAADLLRLGRRLPDLPLLDAALAAGDLGWTKAREIARVATADTEAAWIRRASEVTSRELEHEVARAQLGERPPEGRPGPVRGPARVRRSYELESTDAELVDRMFALIRAQAGLNNEQLDEGAILASVARQLLERAAAEGGEAAPTGTPYMIVVERCPDCARTVGRDAEVTETVERESTCDADIVDMRPGPEPHDPTHLQGSAAEVPSAVHRHKPRHPAAGWRPHGSPAAPFVPARPDARPDARRPCRRTSPRSVVRGRRSPLNFRPAEEVPPERSLRARASADTRGRPPENPPFAVGLVVGATPATGISPPRRTFDRDLLMSANVQPGPPRVGE